MIFLFVFLWGLTALMIALVAVRFYEKASDDVKQIFQGAGGKKGVFLIVFLGVFILLAVIGFVLRTTTPFNSSFITLEKREKAKELEEQQKHKNFLGRLTKHSFIINKPGYRDIAVLVVDEKSNKIDYNITQEITSLLRPKKFNTTAALFSNSFVSDGIFEEIFNGNVSDMERLELFKHIDDIALGKKSVNFTENPEMQNTITARAVVKIHIISAETGAIKNSFSVSEVGAGFSKITAENMAVERIVKNLAEKRWGITK